MIKISPYINEYEDAVIGHIIEFWQCHSAVSTADDARNDIRNWTSDGHALFIIFFNEQNAGFLHLGNRGGTVDWIEDIFVVPELRGQGIASKAILYAEEIVKAGGSTSICMDVVPSNYNAVKLYHRLGYDRLSIITVRKDFSDVEYIGTETVCGLPFKIRKPNS